MELGVVTFGTGAAAYTCSSAWHVKARRTRVMAYKSRVKQVSRGCKTCRGKGAIECPGCKGTGKNKKNGNIFERWKCFDCQGFGLKSCPSCGKEGSHQSREGKDNIVKYILWTMLNYYCYYGFLS